MEDLFKQVGLLLRQTQIKQEEALKRGERFNMFDACGVNHYETTHSAIIASLLDPNGSHGQGSLFLEEWLQVLCIDGVIEPSDAKVVTEFTTCNGRIDILIEDNQNHSIIVENKIYAQDQQEQLKRYDYYAQMAYGHGNYQIVYLTLFGTEATSQSGDTVQYVQASYSRDIVGWLSKCIEKCATLPLIRETLIQYRNHIKALTNQDMDRNEKQELLKLMTEHPRVVDAIVMAASTDYCKYVFDKYVIPELEQYATNRGLICQYENLFASRGERGIFFYRPQWKGMAICLWSDHSGEWGFFWGISNYTECDMSQLERTKFSCLRNKPVDNWPYGWEEADPFRNWDYASGTISAMIEGQFTKYVTEKVDAILQEINEKNIQLI